jgi:hypothetical protein
MLRINKMYKLICLALSICFINISAVAMAAKRTIIFIPLDNRPVCDAYPRNVLKAAGYKVFCPPEKFLATRQTPANTEALLKWLETKVDDCAAAVVSTDALIYGGLVASRTHHLTEAELSQRVERLKNLNMDKNIKLYAFSTLMRTPVESFGNVEPEYYTKLGPTIYKYSQLYDKQDENLASIREGIIDKAIERNIDRFPLQDWLERRDKNMEVNHKLATLAASGRFHYFAVGKDDNAPLSHTHMEARQLSQSTATVSSTEFQILPGVDQLGLLLLARAVNEIEGKTPKIYTLYVEGPGPQTIPQYSDLTLGESVPQQIIAAGGQVVYSADAADVVLAMNTPPDGIMQDSTAPSNQPFASPANKRYISNLHNMITDGRHISLADVAYSNGADNGFMNELAHQGLLTHLTAYNGWNTADNTVGFAIAQGMLGRDIDDNDRLNLLRERVIDDWYYQANARRTITEKLEKANLTPVKYNLGPNVKAVYIAATNIIKDMAFQYDLTRYTSCKIAFPWDRLFEISVSDIKTKAAPSKNARRLRDNMQKVVFADNY